MSKERIKGGLELNNVGHIMDILSKMYKDPIYAVIREYTANAFDGIQGMDDGKVNVMFIKEFHKKFDDNNEVKTDVEYKVAIIDNGIGMDTDQLKNVFTKYGASTKDGDENSIGGFGIGAKSALSLCNRYYVQSTKDGVENNITITKDIDINYDFESPIQTDKRSGTKVVIPISKQDFEKIRRAIRDVKNESKLYTDEMFNDFAVNNNFSGIAKESMSSRASLSMSPISGHSEGIIEVVTKNIVYGLMGEVENEDTYSFEDFDPSYKTSVVKTIYDGDIEYLTPTKNYGAGYFINVGGIIYEIHSEDLSFAHGVEEFEKLYHSPYSNDNNNSLRVVLNFTPKEITLTPSRDDYMESELNRAKILLKLNQAIGYIMEDMDPVNFREFYTEDESILVYDKMVNLYKYRGLIDKNSFKFGLINFGLAQSSNTLKCGELPNIKSYYGSGLRNQLMLIPEDLDGKMFENSESDSGTVELNRVENFNAIISGLRRTTKIPNVNDYGAIIPSRYVMEEIPFLKDYDTALELVKILSKRSTRIHSVDEFKELYTSVISNSIESIYVNKYGNKTRTRLDRILKVGGLSRGSNIPMMFYIADDIKNFDSKNIGIKDDEWKHMYTNPLKSITNALLEIGRMRKLRTYDYEVKTIGDNYYRWSPLKDLTKVLENELSSEVRDEYNYAHSLLSQMNRHDNKLLYHRGASSVPVSDTDFILVDREDLDSVLEFLVSHFYPAHSDLNPKHITIVDLDLVVQNKELIPLVMDHDGYKYRLTNPLERPDTESLISIDERAFQKNYNSLNRAVKNANLYRVHKDEGEESKSIQYIHGDNDISRLDKIDIVTVNPEAVKKYEEIESRVENSINEYEKGFEESKKKIVMDIINNTIMVKKKLYDTGAVYETMIKKPEPVEEVVEVIEDVESKEGSEQN